ncbi:MAG: 16S rRNA (cytosine(1402)-N(4))-methyltransferase RsmH [Vicinamibacterales bacterium]
MSDTERSLHLPVMVDETTQLLQPQRGGTFVDCTLGLGGHTRALLDAGAERVVGIDRDPQALAAASAALAAFGDRVRYVHADYRDIDRVLDAEGVSTVQGALADLGVSSMQFDAPGRGFSFRRDEPLDMRMDQSQGATAAERLAEVAESDLADVIYRFGEERRSRRVARAIVAAREQGPIATTGQLAAIVRRAVAAPGWQRLDPATRTFQALRIWVNGELDRLDEFVRRAALRLAEGGRLAVISFHSLEDRIVKHTLRALDRAEGLVRVLTARPIVASDAEIAVNPRARSAKLRVAERLA